MERSDLNVLFKKYELADSDVFKHKHYMIITRQGIDKIQAKEKIFISYKVEKAEPEFCVVKATANKEDVHIQTFGSAKYGAKVWDKTLKNGQGGWDEQGNTTTWYVMEMAEKRAMSRAVLKLTGFYELGVFGEDESEDFKKETTKQVQPTSQPKKEDKDRKPAFKEGGFEYLTSKETPIEHIKKALEVNRMTPAQRIILEKLVKTFDLTP